MWIFVAQLTRRPPAVRHSRTGCPRGLCSHVGLLHSWPDAVELSAKVTWISHAAFAAMWVGLPSRPAALQLCAVVARVCHAAGQRGRRSRVRRGQVHLPVLVPHAPREVPVPTRWQTIRE